VIGINAVPKTSIAANIIEKGNDRPLKEDNLNKKYRTNDETSYLVAYLGTIKALHLIMNNSITPGERVRELESYELES
jgi:hypothetical protein